jgi:FAD/FMN-containing dehydrogenase
MLDWTLSAGPLPSMIRVKPMPPTRTPLLPLRRRLLQLAALLPFAKAHILGVMPAAAQSPTARVRPGDADWPDAEAWAALGRATLGRLSPVSSPLTDCASGGAAACEALFYILNNPYHIRDEPALAQSLGWSGAWTLQPSAWVVAAETAGDVGAAVNFARERNLRLVVKGGGHSYQGASNAPDSLLIWMRAMNGVALHDGFVPAGCDVAAVPAVSIGGGAIWGEVYAAVTTQTGRYVQGGGCMTVGVAGLVQGGGFGSFSKGYGLAASHLIEAEIVTADGTLRTVNACQNPDLFWALKGGGAGSFGVVTRLTLATHELPEFFGTVSFSVRAASDQAYLALIERFTAFVADSLQNPNWGEQVIFRPDNVLSVQMLFQGITQADAESLWWPFLTAIGEAPDDYTLEGDPLILAVPAQRFWNPDVLGQLPGLIQPDTRPGAPKSNFIWSGNAEEAGRFTHAYRSAWLPATLLAPDAQARLARATFNASRQWSLSWHLNKGLAGADEATIAAARETPVNPAVLDAFALVIIGAETRLVHPDVTGHQPDAGRAQAEADAVARAYRALEGIVATPASYVAESDYFTVDWQEAFWGRNYPRLADIKRDHDPEGLFFVRHGPGSEGWQDDGFSRI